MMESSYKAHRRLRALVRRVVDLAHAVDKLVVGNLGLVLLGANAEEARAV